MTVKRFLILGLTGFFLGGCTVDTSDPQFNNPFDPENSGGPPAPESVTAAVGNNLVRLSWSPPAGTSADEYAVFRKQLAPIEEGEDTKLVGRVSQTTFDDTAVRDGRIERGQLLLFEAFGGGFTWGSALVKF